MDISPEDIVLVYCANEDCLSSRQVFAYPVDYQDCPDCGEVLMEVKSAEEIH